MLFKFSVIQNFIFFYFQNEAKCLASPSVTIATSSGLGNSIGTGWNSDNLLESVVNLRPKSPEYAHHILYNNDYRMNMSNSFIGGSLLGTSGSLLGKGSIDLYREKDEEGTDSELEGDDFDC